MSCFIKITNDLSELTHYDNIKKISNLSNTILKKESIIRIKKKKSRSYF